MHEVWGDQGSNLAETINYSQIKMFINIRLLIELYI